MGYDKASAILFYIGADNGWLPEDTELEPQLMLMVSRLGHQEEISIWVKFVSKGNIGHFVEAINVLEDGWSCKVSCVEHHWQG